MGKHSVPSERYTASQVERILDEEDEDYTSYDAYTELNYGGTWESATLGTLKGIDNWGGAGDGAERGIIFQVGEQFFQKTGYYSSWDSSTWDSDLVEVEPYEKIVTDYRVLDRISD